MPYTTATRAGKPLRKPPATCYYVDKTGGDDLNTGLSPAQAWQNISKVNSSSFSAGNQILFKRGETWSDQLTIAWSGSAGYPIVFGAYGTGARPIFIGNTGDMCAIFVDTAYHHIRIEHIDCNGSNASNYSALKADGHDIYIYDCIGRNSQYWGIGCWSTDGSSIYNNVIDSCIAYDNTASGICISSNTGASGPHDCEIKNCETYNNGTVSFADHGIYVRYGVTVHDNICHDNPVGGGIKLNSEGVHADWSPVCYNNYCYDNYIGIYAVHQEAIITNNLLVNNAFQFDLDGDSHDMLIIHNTIVNAENTTGNTNFRIESSAITGLTIKDNLIIQDQAVSARYMMRGTSTDTMETFASNNGSTIDYNVYYFDGNAATDMFYDTNSLYSWTEWKALTGSPDVHSTFLTTLPGVISRYTNMHPLDSGNLKGKGIFIVGYGYDKDANLRPSPPTPGCYEEEEA